MSSERYLESQAFVVHEGAIPPKFNPEPIYIDLEKLESDEVVVKLKASGICHTDLGAASGVLPGSFPAVFGHEGAGVVHHISANYSGPPLKVGDTVLCSMLPCHHCDQCQLQRICASFIPRSFFSLKNDMQTVRENELEKGGSGKKVRTGFFWQSSLAQYSVCPGEALIKVDPKLPLELMAPMVCGFQTGFGTVVNNLYPFVTAPRRWNELPYWSECGDDSVAAKHLGRKPETSICILGLGGVGFSGLAGAKLCGFDKIICIDIVDARLELAKKHGATHTINSKGMSNEDIQKKVKEITFLGLGVQAILEATGVPAVADMAWGVGAPGSRFAQIGAPPPDAKVNFAANEALATGRTWTAILEGETVGPVFTPYMIKLFEKGHLDFIKDIVKTYKPSEFNQALGEQHAGKTIKPVIVWE